MDEQSSGPANHGDWLGVWFSLSDTPGFRSNHLRYSLSIWLWCNPFPPKARFLICTRWCPITGAVRGHIGLNACLAPRRQHRASDRGGRVIPDVSPMTIPARSSLWDLCLLHLSLSPRKEGKLKKKKNAKLALKEYVISLGRQSRVHWKRLQMSPPPPQEERQDGMLITGRRVPLITKWRRLLNKIF